MAFERFRSLCHEMGETDKQNQDYLAFALHCLGISLNFRDDPRVGETHVLNPHWLTQGIYRILNARLTEERAGALRMADLGDILDPVLYPVETHEFLLAIMRKFEMCFRYAEPRDNEFLLPQLLGKEEPDLGDEFTPHKCLMFSFSYPVWPEGVLPRFIVRTCVLSNPQKRWRTGVVLEFEGNRALVIAYPQDRKISVHVNGPSSGRARLLAIIRSDFERIHSDIEHLNVVSSIQLSDDPSVSLPFEELRGLKAAGIPQTHRMVGGKAVTIDVRQVLGDVEVDGGTIRSVRLFLSYCHRDEEFREELANHLKIFERMELIEPWHDRRIAPGDEWKGQIDIHLENADIILLLLSAHFLASDYCHDIEMRQALRGHARVIPIIARDCKWEIAEFAKLQVLPRDGRPVQQSRPRDKAWRKIADELEAIIHAIAGTPQRM